MNTRESLTTLRGRSKDRSFSLIAILCLVGIATFVASATFLQWTNHAAAAGRAKQPADSSVYFEENRGQFNDRVRYLVHGTAGYSLFLTGTEAVYVISEQPPVDRDRPQTAEPITNKPSLSAPRPERAVAVYMRLAGGNQRAVSEASFELTHRTNYLLGTDKDDWIKGVPSYAQVRTSDVYPGIGLVWRGNANGDLSYDLEIGPDAEPGHIAWEIEGADNIEITPDGGLVIKSKYGDVHPQKPIAARSSEGVAIAEGRYVLLEKGRSGTFRVGFDIVGHAPANNAVSEGTGGLQYSTYLGGGGTELGRQIAVDSSGATYVIGETNFGTFPTTPGVFDPTYTGTGYDGVISKLNPAGSALVYSTYFGGSLTDQPSDLKIDATGNAYITGVTVSNDFPTTAGAYDTTYNGTGIDAFVTKLNADGTALVYSTYLGGAVGNDFGFGLAVDPSGNAYVSGITESSDFPVTGGAYDTVYNSDSVFITKLNAAGSTLVYSTYLGQGGNFDCKIAVDTLGNAYVTGDTSFGLFPTTVGAFDTTYGGGIIDGFVAKLNSPGSALVYSTFLGGSANDGPADMVLDSLNNAYITGYTGSANFPTTPGAFDTTYGSNSDVFVTKLNPSGGALVYSTLIGGTNTDVARGIALDSSNNAYVTGYTSSPEYPTTAGAASPTIFDEDDVFVTKVNGDGTGLLYSTFIGARFDDSGYGIVVDTAGTAYVTGKVQELNFPTTSGAFDRTYNGGGGDAFIVKLIPAPAPPPTPPAIPSGRIVFSTDRDGNTEIYVMNSDGTNQTRVTNNTTTDQLPHFNADGSSIVFVARRDGNDEIYIMNANGTDQTRLTSNTNIDSGPEFSADGGKITFSSTRDGNSEIYIMNADGTDQIRLTNNAFVDINPTFSPDGGKIAFRSDRDGNSEIYIMNATGTDQIRLTNNTTFEDSADFSPDGSKIVFLSRSTSASSDGEIYTMNADGTNIIQVTPGHISSESAPAFSPDGTWVTFTSLFNALTGFDVYVIKADGSGDQVRLTSYAGTDSDSKWAPAPLTASEVSVSGRVTSSAGRGVRSANVKIIDDRGTTRTVRTGSHGNFIFEDVEIGRTYIISVESRRYSFTPQAVQVFDTLTDVDFVAGNF